MSLLRNLILVRNNLGDGKIAASEYDWLLELRLS